VPVQAFRVHSPTKRPARSTLLLPGAERQSEFRAFEEKLEEDARAHRLDESRAGTLSGLMAGERTRRLSYQ